MDTVTPPPRAPLMVRIPPPIWALGYVVAALGLSYLLGWKAVPFLTYTTPGVALIFLGVSLAAWGRAVFARAGTEILPSSPTNKALVRRGPFRLSRNPMYLGIVVTTLGLALLIGLAAAYAVPIAVFLTCDRIVIPFEEAKMERQFGEEYGAYKRKVRRWL